MRQNTRMVLGLFAFFAASRDKMGTMAKAIKTMRGGWICLTHAKTRKREDEAKH